MSNAVTIKNLSKMYKLFHSKKGKILDLIGLNFSKNYNEFWALRDVNLEIKKGEKVGFIGRNGAGKTTLLSIIAGNTSPTSGETKINGKVDALFTLGTGFHPEFSGRDNIIASLAFQGITGHHARNLQEEIIEFAELEDFIEQPVKTYSAGMYARLAFTVATAIRPDILIIDEILGAGDAYFASKALERMKELTGEGATVIFVSHDLSSVQRLCERCVWIEKGRIIADGDTLSVIKGYSADVRKRDEMRLRIKNIGIQKNHWGSNDNHKQLVFRFTGENGEAPKKGISIHRIGLLIDEKLFAEILVGDAMDNNQNANSYIIVDKKLTNWSAPYILDNKWLRDFRDVGGKNPHAAGVFNIPSAIANKKIKFAIDYKAASTENVLFEIFDDSDNTYKSLEKINLGEHVGWNKKIMDCSIINTLNGAASDSAEEKNNLEICSENQESSDVYGTGEIKIKKFEILSENEKEKYVFTINEKVIFRINYEALENVINPVFVIAIYSRAGDVVSQIISSERGFSISNISKHGFIDVILPALKIGAGEYMISVAIFRHVDLSNPAEQEVFDLHDRKYFFKVTQPFNINMPLGLIYQDAKFYHQRSAND